MSKLTVVNKKILVVYIFCSVRTTLYHKNIKIKTKKKSLLSSSSHIMKRSKANIDDHQPLINNFKIRACKYL